MVWNPLTGASYLGKQCNSSLWGTCGSRMEHCKKSWRKHINKNLKIVGIQKEVGNLYCKALENVSHWKMEIFMCGNIKKEHNEGGGGREEEKGEREKKNEKGEGEWEVGGGEGEGEWKRRREIILKIISNQMCLMSSFPSPSPSSSPFSILFLSSILLPLPLFPFYFPSSFFHSPPPLSPPLFLLPPSPLFHSGLVFCLIWPLIRFATYPQNYKQWNEGPWEKNSMGISSEALAWTCLAWT